jgi:hypothetical protein
MQPRHARCFANWQQKEQQSLEFEYKEIIDELDAPSCRAHGGGLSQGARSGPAKAALSSAGGVAIVTGRGAVAVPSVGSDEPEPCTVEPGGRSGPGTLPCFELGCEGEPGTPDRSMASCLQRFCPSHRALLELRLRFFWGQDVATADAATVAKDLDGLPATS